MNTKDLKVTITIQLTEENIEDLVVTALEGGIGYWACLMNDTPTWDKYNAKYPDEPFSIIATKMLLDGEPLIFTDAETGEEFEPFCLTELLDGIEEYVDKFDREYEQTKDDVARFLDSISEIPGAVVDHEKGTFKFTSYYEVQHFATRNIIKRSKPELDKLATNVQFDLPVTWALQSLWYAQQGNWMVILGDRLEDKLFWLEGEVEPGVTYKVEDVYDYHY